MPARTVTVLIDATNVLATMHLTNALAQRTTLPHHQFAVTVVRITSQASKAAQNWQTFSNHAKPLLKSQLQSHQDNSRHKSATPGSNDSKPNIKTFQSWTIPLTFRASSVNTSQNRSSVSPTSSAKSTIRRNPSPRHHHKRRTSPKTPINPIIHEPYMKNAIVNLAHTSSIRWNPS